MWVWGALGLAPMGRWAASLGDSPHIGKNCWETGVLMLD